MNLIQNQRSIAFLHFPKCAGTFVAKYLKQNILKPDYRCPNPKSQLPWHDYTIEEIIDLATKPKHFLWTHSISPTVNMIEDFGHTPWQSKRIFNILKQNNWFTFGFVRDPRDALCSMYFYGQDNINKPGFEWAKQETLNEFIIRWNYRIFDIPPFWREFDFISEFSYTSFAIFLKRYFSHSLKLSKRENESSNKGYSYYCKAKMISNQTQSILNNCNNVKTFLQIKRISPTIKLS